MTASTRDGVATCLIVANGAVPGRRFLRKLAAGASAVIATDGGAGPVLRAGLQPTYVIGDFDSIAPEVMAALPAEAIVHAEDQDRCDLEKALELARSLGWRRILVTGALGKRLDHTLTTVSLLMRYAASLDLRVVEPGMELVAVASSAEIHGKVGDILSLIVLGPVSGVSLTGVKWCLHDARLEPGSRGVSNVLTESVARVCVTEGTVLVCHLGRL